jgi:hypothetical protein
MCDRGIGVQLPAGATFFLHSVQIGYEAYPVKFTDVSEELIASIFIVEE